MKTSFSLCAIFFVANITFAQTPMNVVDKQPTAIETKKEIRITELGWMDKNRMDQETTKINELAQTKLGTPLRRNLNDLNTLQRTMLSYVYIYYELN